MEADKNSIKIAVKGLMSMLGFRGLGEEFWGRVGLRALNIPNILICRQLGFSLNEASSEVGSGVQG